MGVSRLTGKRLSGTQYKCVSEWESNLGGRKQITFYGEVVRVGYPRIRSRHETAKGAALALDKKLIESGLEPINILKKISV